METQPYMVGDIRKIDAHDARGANASICDGDVALVIAVNDGRVRVYLLNVDTSTQKVYTWGAASYWRDEVLVRGA